ncbi:unnamed protein product, partial [Meganyctiphanes norvegica]
FVEMKLGQILRIGFSALLLIVVLLLLFYNRIVEIIGTTFYSFYKLNSYNNFYTELQVTARLLDHQHQLSGENNSITANSSHHYRVIGSDCTHVSNVKQILYSNIYWQIMIRPKHTSVFLYSSYYDNRTLLNNNPVIRTITIFKKLSKHDIIYCYLWFANDSYAIISRITLISRASWKEFWPQKNSYIITCPVPHKIRHKIPLSVSISRNTCGPITNLLPVVNNKPENSLKKDFAICIKALDYVDVDISLYMVEWLELLFLMGVDKVFAYEYTVHSNISRVLQHYVDIGRLLVTPITLPGDAPNDPVQRHKYLEKTKYDDKK